MNKLIELYDVVNKEHEWLLNVCINISLQNDTEKVLTQAFNWDMFCFEWSERKKQQAENLPLKVKLTHPFDYKRLLERIKNYQYSLFLANQHIYNVALKNKSL